MWPLLIIPLFLLFYAAWCLATDRQLRRNLKIAAYIFTRYGKLISMSLTTQQLATLQSDLDTLKAAVTADTTAQAAIVSDQAALTAAQTQLTTDTAAQVQTAAAVTAAEQQLLADANSDFAPPMN